MFEQDQDQEYLKAAMERLQVELGWYRQHMRDDYRGELADLIDEHFQGLRELAYAFMALGSVLKRSGLPYEAIQKEMDTVMEKLTELGPHAEKFKKLYGKMPDRNDMFLATIDTPPHKM